MSLKLRRRRRTIAGTGGQSGGSGPTAVPTIWDEMLAMGVRPNWTQPKKKKKRTPQEIAALAISAGLF